MNAPQPAPDPQSVAAPLLVSCRSCATYYLFLATPDQLARYEGGDGERREAVQDIFPAMPHTARGVLSLANTCAFCIMFTPSAEVFAALSPHVFDPDAAVFVFRGTRHMIITTRYLNNGRPALGLFRTASAYQLLTVNSPAIDLEGDEILVREGGEWSGLCDALAAQLVIEAERRPAGDDHPDTFVCKLVNPSAPKLSDPRALIDAEASETLEGFVTGSDRRYRYVALGEAVGRDEADDYEPVGEVEEWAPGARALLAKLNPTDVLYVPVHHITRRPADGRLFSREAGERFAREVRAPRRPAVRIPHDPGLTRELEARITPGAFGPIKGLLLRDPTFQCVVVGEDYAAAELAAFSINPPAENSAALWSRMLDAGVFSIVSPSGADADADDGGEAPALPPHTISLDAIPDEQTVYALAAPPVYFVKLPNEPRR